MINETIKITLPNNLNSTFNSRERHLNVEIQKIIDSYNKKGYTVIDHEAIHKTGTHATIRFNIQNMISVR
jgi:predicted GNAT superfamily acetyltransferase